MVIPQKINSENILIMQIIGSRKLPSLLLQEKNILKRAALASFEPTYIRDFFTRWGTDILTLSQNHTSSMKIAMVVLSVKKYALSRQY